MNKIDFPRVSYDGTILTQDALEKWYTKTFENKIKVRLDTEVTHVSSHRESLYLNYIKSHLHDILLASPVKLEKIADFTGQVTSEINDDFKQDIFNAFHYDGFRKGKLVLLAEKLNIKTCPYCNMQYTLFAEDGKNQTEKLAKLQFDHFFDKRDYPNLSMSLYNLIPSCAVCNQGKSTARLSLAFHPYHSAINRQFHFEVDNPLQLFIGGQKNDKIDIKLKKDNATQDELDKFNQTFHLELLYSRHRDVVQEAFAKAYTYQYYSKSQNFSFLKGPFHDVLRRLWQGVYPRFEDEEKRPMSKFVHDMWRQAFRLNP